MVVPGPEALTAGWILLSSSVRLPIFTLSIAPLTAPQAVWPMTTMSLTPTTLTAYSRDPRLSALTTFPATRMLKRSPMAWSKTNSTGTRESMQLRTAAKGYCPPADALTFAGRPFWTVWPARNRAFPSFKASRALDGVMAACESLVWTTEADILGADLAAAFGASVCAPAVEAAKRATVIHIRKPGARMFSLLIG